MQTSYYVLNPVQQKNATKQKQIAWTVKSKNKNAASSQNSTNH